MPSNLQKMFVELSTTRVELAEFKSEVDQLLAAATGIKKLTASIIKTGEHAENLRKLADGIDKALDIVKSGAPSLRSIIKIIEPAVTFLEKQAGEVEKAILDGDKPKSILQDVDDWAGKIKNLLKLTTIDLSLEIGQLDSVLPGLGDAASMAELDFPDVIPADLQSSLDSANNIVGSSFDDLVLVSEKLSTVRAETMAAINVALDKVLLNDALDLSKFNAKLEQVLSEITGSLEPFDFLKDVAKVLDAPIIGDIIGVISAVPNPLDLAIEAVLDESSALKGLKSYLLGLVDLGNLNPLKSLIEDFEKLITVESPFTALQTILTEFSDSIIDLAGIKPLYEGDTITLGDGEKFAIGNDGFYKNFNGLLNDGGTKTIGNDLDNFLTGGFGDDILQGGAGNDILIGGEGNDTLEGGIGIDGVYLRGNFGEYRIKTGGTVDADGNQTEITATHFDPSKGTKKQGTDVLHNIEWLIFNDRKFHISDLGTVSYPDFVNGIVTGSDTNGIVIESVFGLSGNETLNGLGGNDYLFGSIGNDTLFGGAGDDLLEGGRGIDSIDGGTGNDTAVYNDIDSFGVQIALSQTSDVPFETEEILNDVENLVGSSGDDWLWGDDGDNKLEGGLGSDILHGGAGNDELDGGRGSYQINDFDGEDYAIGNVLIGGDGHDIVRGGFYSFENADPFPGESDRLSATDIFVGGEGNDTYISGLESNALLWYGGDAPSAPFFDDLPDPSEFGVLDLPSRVDVDLVNKTVRKFDLSGNSMGVDTLENIIGVMGSAGDDTFLASSNQEILLGGEGNDRFIGGEANTETPWSDNRLEARDFFMGNGGNDVFRPAAGHTEIIGGLGNDRIFINDSGFVIVQGDEVFDADTSDTDTLDFSTSDKEWIIDATGEYFGDPSKDATVIDQIVSTGQPDVTLVDVGSAEGYDSGSRAALTLKSYADYDSVQDRLVWNTFGGIGFSAERNIESYEAEVLDSALDYVEFLQIENIFGSRYNDFIAGNDFANKLMGRAGDDVIIGHLNADGSGDTLFGEAGNDVLLGAENNDTLNGGFGDDLLIGGQGGDTLQGGADFDTVDYSGSNKKVRIDLTAGTAENGHASGDKLTSIEAIVGTRFNDILKGSDAKNNLKGGNGADLIIATTGNDILNGGKGTDTLSFNSLTSSVIISLRLNNALTADSVYNIKLFENVIGTAKADLLEGNNGKNKLEGSGGGDTLNGLGGNDLLIGGRGKDSLDGGKGFDIADYSASNKAVQVDLKIGTANGGHASGDTFSSIEGLIGSSFNDTLHGNSNANTFTGGKGDDLIITGKGNDSILGGAGDDVLNGQNGNDSLNSGKGNDRIIGGEGNDKLWGAQGKDVFVFRGDTDTGRDRIKDFNNGVDMIEISGSTKFSDLKITKKFGNIKIEWADNVIFLEDESGPINSMDFDFV